MATSRPLFSPAPEADLRDHYSAVLLLSLSLAGLARHAGEDRPAGAGRPTTPPRDLGGCLGRYLSILDACLAFQRSCEAPGGLFSLSPGGEGHAGGTFCAVALLRAAGVTLLFLRERCAPLLPEPVARELDRVLRSYQAAASGLASSARLLRSLSSLQITGFAGRPNKPECSCYALWTFGCLRMLGKAGLCDFPALSRYTMAAEYRKKLPQSLLRMAALQTASGEGSRPEAGSTPASPLIALAADAVERGEDFLRAGFVDKSGEPDPLHGFACLYALLTREAGFPAPGPAPQASQGEEEYLTPWLLPGRIAGRLLPGVDFGRIGFVPGPR